MVASSRDGLLMVGFSVMPLLELCISGWLWEEFAPAHPVPRGVCTLGGDGFASVFGPFGLQAARGWRSGVHPVKGGSLRPSPSATRLLVSMGTGSKSILRSGQRGRGGEEMAATFPRGCGRAVTGSAHQPALISQGMEVCCGLQAHVHIGAGRPTTPSG